MGLIIVIIVFQLHTDDTAFVKDGPRMGELCLKRQQVRLYLTPQIKSSSKNKTKSRESLGQ